MGLLSPRPPRDVLTSHSGCQEVHVDGADLAGLAFAIRLAENLPATGRTLVHVWDERLQRMGMQRKRRLAFRSPGKDVDSGQAVTLHGSVLNAAVSSHTQAAIFPEGKQQLWEDTGNTSISKVEEALLRRAQSPDFAQHIVFDDHDLSKEILQDIASKPHVIIIGTDGGHSTICSSFATAQITQDEQEVTCRIELAYQMDEGLKRALKESAATSVVHTIGQRVFLHNFDCKGEVGSVLIRATKAELDELAHYRQQTSVSTLGAVGKELKRKESPAAVSLSDLIDTALQVYGIPAKAVRRITGTQNSLSRAPFFARELHPNSTDGGHLMLIGDAAMRVEFWPGKGINAAFATAHVAAASLLSSMTNDASQPCFALSPNHLQAFSLHMTDVADQFGAFHSMDLLPAPAACSRWAVISKMAPEDVLNELMAQICERGATAVDHLSPMIPRFMLVEARLRQMIPSKVHVLRRMLRDGPWPGESAEVMAPISLPPLPSHHFRQVPDTSLAAPSSSGVTAPAQRLNEAPNLTFSRHYDSSLAQTFRRRGDLSPPTPVSRHADPSPVATLSRHEHAVLRPHSTSHTAVRETHSPTISITAPARKSPAQQSDVEAILAGRTLQHVSVGASSDQSSFAHPPTPDSARSSISVDSATVSEIEARIAVLTKWGQLVPPSLHLPQAFSHHANNSAPCLNRQDMRQPGSSMSHDDSASTHQLSTETQSKTNTQMMPETVSAAPPPLRQQAAAETERLQRASKGAQSPHSMPQAPLQQSSQHPQPSNLHHPQRAPAPSQGQRQQLQAASAAPFGSPFLTRSSLPQSSLPQSSPPSAQSSLSLPWDSPQLPHQAPPQGYQESKGLREAGPGAKLGLKAQSARQMWPYVHKYAVPPPPKAGSTIDLKTAPPAPPQGVPDTPLLQPSTNVSQQQQRVSLRQSSDRHSGMAEPSSRASPNWSPSPVLLPGTASATLPSQTVTNLPTSESQQPVDSSIQPQTPLASPSHRRMYSQDASQQQADVAGPEVRTMAGSVGGTPEWMAQQGMAGNAADSGIWQTPQLPSTWSGQGNPLFGWWELGAAVIGDEELHQHEAKNE